LGDTVEQLKTRSLGVRYTNEPKDRSKTRSGACGKNLSTPTVVESAVRIYQLQDRLSLGELAPTLQNIEQD